MNKHTGICTILIALGGCAAGGAGVPVSEHELDTVQMGDADGSAVSGSSPVSEAPADLGDVELAVAAVDAAAQPLDVRSCELLSRNPGDFTNTRMVDPFHVPCSDSVDGIARLAVDGRSEVAVTLSAADYPLYLTHVTTGAKLTDLSNAPLRLLSSARIEAAYASAQIGAAPQTSAVIVETNVEGGVYELLVNTTDEGPMPIYLDAEGRAVMGASTSIAGGWAVFANVPMGLHAVTFGHASEQLERVPSMGWAGCSTGDTLVWALPGYTSLVAGIEPASDAGI